LQNKRINIEQVEDDYYSTAAHLLSEAKQAPTLFEKANYEQKRSLINLVLSNLQLDGNLLRWELKKPFDTMAFCNENNNWLGIKDSNYSFTPIAKPLHANSAHLVQKKCAIFGLG
jgi:hypothetical protein